MYPVSRAYINKLKSKDTKIRRIRGYVDSIPFTENDVLEGSFSYTDMCVKSSEIKLGGVFIATLNLTFLQSFVNRFPRGSWKDRVITCSVGLFLGYDANNEEIWEDVPVKPYIIDDPQHSALGLDVVAYDAMKKFNVPLTMDTTSGTIYDIAIYACLICGVQFGMTRAECELLPNGTKVLGFYPENDCETWRDVISWLAVQIGGFATINRSGELEFRTWKDGTNPDIEIGVNDRFTGGKWSDFSTNYSEVAVTNYDGTVDYYSVTPNNGMTMELGQNPFMQYGTSLVREEMARNVLTALQNLKYVPFSSTSLIDPALDLGDIILYSDGIADDAISCVMRLDFSYTKGATVKGYGKNPAQSGAKSSTDKALKQAMSKTSDNELVTHTYINSMPYAVGNQRSEDIIGITFATKQPRKVIALNEIKADIDVIDTTNGAKVTLYYYLNDQLESYQPVGTYFHDGVQTFDRMYFFDNLLGSTAYEWRVEIRVDGGTATIDRGDIHAVLQGQGLVAIDEFAGTIRIEDTYEPIPLDHEIVEINEAVELLIRTIDLDLTHTDYFDTANIGKKDIPVLYDDCRVNFSWSKYAICSDDGQFAVCSDDGQYTLINSDGGYFL